MKKKIIFFALGFSLLLFFNSLAQPITPNFFGQNAWYTVYTDDGQPTASNDAFVNYIADVQASGATFCRIGGANANILGNNPSSTPNPITKLQVLFLVKKIRAAGMEPIITVPYPNDLNDNHTLQTWALNAADIVDYINNINVGSIPGGRVDNWIIANEPDKDMYGGFKIGYNYNEFQTTSPTEIAKYIKQFAIEMRKKIR